MKISVEDFAALPGKAPVIIHSLDQALYQVTVLVDGVELLLVGTGGKPLRSHSLEQLREVLSRFPVASLVLRQQSAYDEMIGQPLREGANTLEIELSLPAHPAATRH